MSVDDDPPLESAADPLLEPVRMAEALIFAAAEPIAEGELARLLPPDTDLAAVLDALKARYAGRGIVLRRVAQAWTFRSAPDLAWLLAPGRAAPRKLSRAALETLAIVAYHQPVTRAEIEEIRGVALSKGTMDVLIETEWVRLRARRKTPGRPVTYGTTDAFLLNFGLEAIGDLPGLEELRSTGLFDGRLPSGFSMPQPDDSAELKPDEEPFEGEADTSEPDDDRP